MRQIKFIALLASRFILRYRLILLALFLVMLGIWALLRYQTLWRKTDTLSEGIIGAYTQSSLPQLTTNLLSGSLVTLDKQGLPQASLAKSWQVNEDATIYTFRLRDNLYWNDGTKLKSSEIHFNLSDVDVTYPDDQTIQFKLSDSFSVFPTLLTGPIFKGESFVGTGQYRISYQEVSRGIVTKLIMSPIKNQLPVLVIRFYPDDKTAITAFNLGEVDTILGVSDSDPFGSFPKTEIKKVIDYHKFVAVFYSTKDPILKDKNLRRALSFAAPKITDQERIKSPIPPNSWAYNDEVRDYSNDPEILKNYLDKMGEGKNATLTLISTPSLSSLAEKIVEAWKAAGLNVILRVESGSPQNFQALLTTADISSDPDQYTLWHSTQTLTNLSKYKSDRVDKDLEDGRRTVDMKVREEKYLDFQKVLLDDAPATFLYFPTFNVVLRSKEKNLIDQILPLQLPST